MKQPIVKYRAGVIECSVWENSIETPTGQAKVLKATVERRYRHSNGNWSSTNSYGVSDLPRVMHVLQQAYAEIIARDNERSRAKRENTTLERGGAV